jgi:hypothetical protein
MGAGGRRHVRCLAATGAPTENRLGFASSEKSDICTDTDSDE